MADPAKKASADAKAPPAKAGKPGGNVIRVVNDQELEDQLLKRYVPAFGVSTVIHAVLVSGLFLIMHLFPEKETVETKDMINAEVTKVEKKDVRKMVLETDISLDDRLKAIKAEKLDEMNIETPVNKPKEPAGNNLPTTKKLESIKLSVGMGNKDKLGYEGTKGSAARGNAGMGGRGNEGYAGRTSSTRARVGEPGGGTSASEAAVARGLAYLARVQRDNGSWVYEEGSSSADVCSSTAMALLPFLAAGQTHKPGEGNIYQKTVDKGLKFLVSLQVQPAGNFRTSSNMYSHAIAAVALCELYGMTGDKNVLYPAKLAIDYIIKGQGANGSWGYKAGTEGDTSIVGWQIQALKSAVMCKDIPVPPAVFDKANKFLDSVSNKTSKMSTYGYRDGPGARGTALTAVGLLSRYYTGWGPIHPAFMEGVEGLNKVSPPNKARFNMYYYYYATQVVHFHGQEVWEKDWNPKMRDMLVEMQVKLEERKGLDGSWAKDQGMIGSHCGRLGTTCFALLTLEVYYRHLPLYKTDGGGAADR